MRFLFAPALLIAAGTLASLSAQAQQTTSQPAALTATPAPTLSDDSVRVMSGLVEASVRRLRAIYFEPNDAKAAQLIDAALVEIPVLNQRLSHYTASLPREQQQLLAQRLRQQPWQVELNTLLRSPQYKGFDARAAKTPELQAAAERLHASGFVGTAKPVPAKPSSAAPAPAKLSTASALAATPAKVQPASAQGAAVPPRAPVTTAPAKAAGPAAARPASSVKVAPVAAVAVSTARHHTVQKGETLYSIARQHNVTQAQLQEWNHKPAPTVQIGEVLLVEESK